MKSIPRAIRMALGRAGRDLERNGLDLHYSVHSYWKRIEGSRSKSRFSATLRLSDQCRRSLRPISRQHWQTRLDLLAAATPSALVPYARPSGEREVVQHHPPFDLIY